MQGLTGRSRGARLGLLLALLGLHIALFLAVSLAVRRPAAPPGLPGLTAVVIVPMVKKPPPPPVPTTRSAVPARATAAARPAATRLIEAQGQAPVASVAALPSALPASAPAAPAPLNLSLPPGSAATDTLTKRNPALTDPRSHSVRRDRMAAALGSKACMLDERLPDGTVVRVPGHYADTSTASATSDPFGHAGSTGGGFDSGAALGGGSRGTKAQFGGGGTVTVCLRDAR